MSSLLNIHLPDQVTDSNGKVVANAQVYIYDAGTTTDSDTYLDNALATQHPQPVLADAAGRFPLIYVPSGQLYKVVTQTSAGAEIQTLDNLSPYIGNDGSVPLTSGGTGATTAGGARTNLGAASQAEFLTLSTTVSDATTAQSQAVWNAGVSTNETVISSVKLTATIKDVEAKQSGVPDATLWEELTLGTPAGGLVANTPATRFFNTKLDLGGSITLESSAGDFTPAKDGWISVVAPFYASGKQRLNLYNVTDSVDSTFINPNAEIITSVAAMGIVTGKGPVVGGKTYRVTHISQVTRTTEAMGRASNLLTNEKYATLDYWQNNGE